MKKNFGVTRKKQEELEARMAALGLREADLEEKYVRSSGPDANETGADGETWYRYTEQWPTERTNPPFYFKIEAQGHRWFSGTYSLTYFWVDDAGFSDEFGDMLILNAGNGNFEDLCISCYDWLMDVP
jgi:hypothetical protein